MRYVIVLFCLTSSTLWAETYQCRSAAGELLFTDAGCGDGDWQKIEVVISDVTGNRVDPPSEAERNVVDKLSRKRQERRMSRLANRARHVREATTLRHAKEQNCQDSRSELTELRQQRRRGYLLADREVLDNRQAELRTAVRTDC